MERWIALDLETTGLSPTRHEIRELAMVPFGIEESHAALVLNFNSGDFKAPSEPVTRARLIEAARLAGDGAVLVAHNAAFDLAFLAEALRRVRVSPFILRGYCTLRLARKLLPASPSYDLAALQAALGLNGGKRHVALNDARAVAEIFPALVRHAGLATHAALRSLHGPPILARSSSAYGNVAPRPPRGDTKRADGSPPPAAARQ